MLLREEGLCSKFQCSSLRYSGNAPAPGTATIWPPFRNGRAELGTAAELPFCRELVQGGKVGTDCVGAAAQHESKDTTAWHVP